MIRRWGGVLLAVAGVLAAGLPADAGQGTAIRRTSYGIPHIRAADYRGLGVGLGYAFAEDNACVMADIAVTLSAERSRWFGPDAATGYPSIVGNTGTERSARTRLGLDMIADRLDGSDGLGAPGFTLSTLQATMFGNRNLTAEQGRQSIVAMCRANAVLTAGNGQSVDVRAACAALAVWNGKGDTGEAGRGAFFWRAFMNMARRPDISLWKVPFDPADPVRTPRDVNADDPGVRQAFADAVQRFAAADVPADVPLDAIQSYAGIPIHGCTGPEGCFNVISVPGAVGETSDVRHGTSFIMAAELTKAGPRMRSLMVYGQSANQASPHRTDQTRLYMGKQWVTGLFTEAEIARDPHLTVQVLAGK